MVQLMDVLRAAAEEVSTSSTKLRIRIFRENLLPLIHTKVLSPEDAGLLVGIVFETLLIYDDRPSRKAVDDFIVAALREAAFMKCFAAVLIQFMEKHLKCHSHVGCLKLLKWSCLLLRWSQFVSLSKGGFLRLATGQAYLCRNLMHGAYRMRKACRELFFHTFSQVPYIYKMYMEELNGSRICLRDSGDLIRILLEFSISNSSLFDKYKMNFLDLYLKVVLHAMDTPPRMLAESFQPLFVHIEAEDFQNLIFPSSIKMLKRNPEIIMDSIVDLLSHVNMDMSKYVIEFLSVVLPQARHANDGRRTKALAIIGCLSQMSSDPDALPSIFNAVKDIIGGSEGKLALPYQRVGMVNVLEELSRAPDGKTLKKLAPMVSTFLLSCYKGEGSDEVKVAILAALSSWALKSPEAIQPDVVSFLAAGLKEKEILRRGHLRCLRVICRNPDLLTKVVPLLEPLVQIVKTGFTKTSQKLDCIYALFSVAKVAAVDTKGEEILVKEKLWQMLAQSEPSLIPFSLIPKLSNEDCMTCIDVVVVLLIEHQCRAMELLSTKALLQLLLYLMCHPSYDVRQIAYDASRKIMSSSMVLSEVLLLQFRNLLQLVGDRVSAMKLSDTESTMDGQIPIVPPAELLVKCLLLIAPAAMPDSRTLSVLMFCAHHPCLVGSGFCDAVWKRLQKNLQKCHSDMLEIVASNVEIICQELLGSSGLLSSNSFEQVASLHSLLTLMRIAPNGTFSEFEKHFNELPDCSAHAALSENDIKIFYTPEGMLSTEQGVYVAETVAAKNIKLAKGRYRLYDDQDDSVNSKSSHSLPKEPSKRDPINSGKKDAGKTSKKNDKTKNAKEEAREQLLMEEAAVREKVSRIQSNLSVVLKALSELAFANPVFAHTQLPLLVKFVEPFLRSRIVNAAAFEAIQKLSSCLAPPLSIWATEIAVALNVISDNDMSTVLDLVPQVTEAEMNKVPNVGIFEKIVSGLLTSCKSGPLPTDSFAFVFPILEKILLSPKKTALHDDVLHIISLHVDPILPLPRARMLKALYHVLGTVPSYQALVGPMLNQICLGLKPCEIATAMSGIYGKDVHVRLSCLNALKCIPCVSGHSMPQDIHTATGVWIALHDPEKVVAEAAEEVWDCYGFDFGTDYSGLIDALSHVNYNVRVAAAEALAAALDESPETIQDAISTLFSIYIRDLSTGFDVGDPCWIGRQGIALALHSAADVLRTKDLPVVMTFLISRALADPNMDVRGRMINAGVMIIDKHGKENVPLLFPIFDSFLNKKTSDEEKYDLVREGVVIFTGALAKHLEKDDPKIHAVVEKLLDVLNTPSEAVQRAVSGCLSPLMASKNDDGQALVSSLLDRLMKADKYGERRGAAFGLAGVVKGFRVSCLKKYGVVIVLQQGLEDRNSAKSREGALLGFECLCEKLGRLFEPYVIQLLPLLLVAFSDPSSAVREAAECAARAMMSQLTVHGVKLILPSLLKGLEDKAWRTKQSSVQLLGAMAYCAPQQLSQCLPTIVPKLTEVLTDSHPKVQSAGQDALQQVGSVIKNPEISALVPTLLLGLSDPNQYTKHSLDVLLQTTFINSVDAPSLALLVPIVHRGLRERSSDTKKKAAQIVGNMCSLVTDPKDMIPYIGLLLPEVKKVLVDPIPEVRAVAARAIGSLIRGMGEENFPDLVPWLLETLKSESSNVQRSGAAQGLSEVLAALGKDYFEHILPDIIRNCSHQRASVRDGHLTLFKYLPRSLGVMFQNYLQTVLPAILDGLADENESVRDAALSAGHVFVEHYATTSLPLLLPAVEDGIFNDNWRIRQSSVELLGDLLFKVAGTSGKALLEGGSDDEGSSTEAHGRAIIEVLGKDKRNEVLAAIYMVRSDVTLSVRQAALHVWKTIVANTPKTLKEIMPVLMNTLISSLASSSSDRRQVAGRSLGELVRKLGERVLPSIIPFLSQGLNDTDTSRRQGVCIGLSEVMASAGKHQLLSFMDDLIPTIRTALCDSMPEVRESAGLAFSTLYKSAGMQAIDDIVPTLLRALEDDETSDTALDGLKQILSVRTSAVLPHILPKLVHLPLSAFSAHALGALAEVAGSALNFHVGTVLPALLVGMGDDDEDVRHSAKKAAETVLLVVDEEGVESLLSELLKGVGDNQALIRRGSCYLIGYFFKNSKLYLVDETPDMISTLIVLLSDPDSVTVLAAWEALGRVVSSVPKEVLSSYIKVVRDAISTARDKERRKRKGGHTLIPGFCLPKALQPLLPIFLQGLISGSAETREQAAEGLGELIDVTSEQTLKDFVIPITGPLIRIIGDRFPWQVKGAILSTLSIIISKGGIALKPFLPQLQTTFIKCLQDNTRTVRTSSALALGKLTGLSTRVDPLVCDLLSTLQSSDGGVREAVLTALRGVIKHSGKNISNSVRSRLCTLMLDLINVDVVEVREHAGKVLGNISKYMEDIEFVDLLQILSGLSTSTSWISRHGAMLTLASMAVHSPSFICQSSSFPTVVGHLRSSLKDDKFPVREAATNALGKLLKHVVKHEEHRSSSSEILGLLLLALLDDAGEVRRKALSSIKAAAKVNQSAIMACISTLGPAIAECLKDGSMPVRLAAERCALHVFLLSKGSDYVQAAQKYITGIDARRLSKLPENSDEEGSSEDDTVAC
ncbi:hypothetical protein HPP92_001295 [Vanilla planifolia]|uniref:TOG domain-containing protein n=1 Tax=Vanilla planifolia TaxID=51239 RepID=A0A835RW02_VANPL|nr:hypothetical protein HPP92_001295 [Vanilla planifolia]